MSEVTRSYYTNTARTGKTLLIREIRNGKRRRFKHEYKPTLYTPTANPTNFKAPDGTPVKAVQPGNMNDCYQFMEKCKNTNVDVYGNTSYPYAYINEEYPDKIDYFKLSDMVLFNLDIEVDSKTGYHDARDAEGEITAITIKSSVDNKFHVFACQPFDEIEYNRTHSDSVIEYNQCDNEEDMLQKFLDFWETNEPDIVTGWHVRIFDIPYIINRIALILSSEDANRLSPWGVIRESTINIYNKPEVVYDVVGVSILDLLLLYRKNVLEPRESYRLDYIAEVELKEGKVDYGEYGTLQELFEKDFKKFIEYNIHDVRLVDRIDAKRKLIELQLIVAYHAKINFEDVMSQVRMWDTTICNHLLKKNVVIPQKVNVEKTSQFTGAYVMKPKPGLYEWVASVDVQSLYPNIMRTLNMGMETKLSQKELTPEMKQYQKYIALNLMIEGDDGKPIVDPNAIIDGMPSEFFKHLKQQKVTVGANAAFYHCSPQSFYSELITELFNNRLEYRAKLKKAEQELSTCTDPVRKAELENIKADFDLKQKATKIILNSLYGAIGNQWFRFYDVKNAEAVTTTGQFIIQYVGHGIDDYLNKMMKTKDVKYVLYSDTDSCYVTFKDMVDKYHPQGTVMEKCEYVDILCKQALQPEISRLFKVMVKKYLNGMGDYLLMNREDICDKGIFTAKKRYLLAVRDKEGIKKDPAELKYMGVEIKKTTVPKFCRDAMEEAVKIVLEKDQEILYKFLADTKIRFEQQPIENISSPRGVHGLEKYSDSNLLFKKGTPYHVKGVLAYNFLIDKYKLESKYPKIREGEKIRFFYLTTPNPFIANTMAFVTKVPPEFKIEEYINWDLQWQKSMIEPLMLILNAIKWDTQRRASLDDAFESVDVVQELDETIDDGTVDEDMEHDISID